MDKLTNDANNLKLQQAAFQAGEFEKLMGDAYMEGSVVEQEYLNAMEATEMAVEFAVSKGVSRKDLPAV